MTDTAPDAAERLAAIKARDAHQLLHLAVPDRHALLAEVERLQAQEQRIRVALAADDDDFPCCPNDSSLNLADRIYAALDGGAS